MGWLKKPTIKKAPEPIAPKTRPILPVPDTETSATGKRQLAPDEVNEYGDYIKIGGSPVPGLTLRHVLRGHIGQIDCLAWSPDGGILATGSQDRKIKLWNSAGKPIGTCSGHELWINGLTWSPDSKILASGSSDNTVRLWNPYTQAEIVKPISINKASIYAISWSPNGKIIAVVGSRTTEVHLINVERNYSLDSLGNKNEGSSTALTWSSNNVFLYQAIYRYQSGNPVGTIVKHDVASRTKTYFSGHAGRISSIACSPDGTILASASFDKTIKLWRTEDGRLLQTLEGHSDHVHGICFSHNGELIASKSCDASVRVWQWRNGRLVVVFQEYTKWDGQGSASSAIAFNKYNLTTLGEKENIIRIWELNVAILLAASTTLSASHQSINYTTAKLVLVGDSGVGKTGLGWRLAHGKFKDHTSTHGQQFWTIPELGLKRKDGTDCEAVLWDLAGQHVYRQVHSIFLENVAVALVLFDPTNRQEPLKGAQFWLEQLKGKGQLPPTVLVGARVDRGAPAISHDELNQFCQRYGIKGGYLSTSALKGDGLDKLLEIVKAQIPWDDMTATVTTVTFKRIKDYVLSLKEKTDRKWVLVSPDELKALLEAASKAAETAEAWEFTDAEMMTAVGHLETHGFVSVLRNSAGEQTILLTPDLLVNLAASIMLLADKNSRELGAVSETQLLQGQYPFDELNGLEPHEAQTLLDAAILRFLEHNICFRETLGNETLLIFPNLIKQKRPLEDKFESVDDVSYILRGRVENIYASMVVLLGYTTMFTRINQWQNQAQYEIGAGEICGFRLTEEREGEMELILYYSSSMPDYGRPLFQGLFEKFIYQRDVEVMRVPPVFCPQKHRIERATVMKRIRDGKDFAFCDECGERTSLPEIEKPEILGGKQARLVIRGEVLAKLRSLYETHLTRIKSFRRDRAAPRCFITYHEDQFTWVADLVHDLRDAGVIVLERREQVKAEDFVLQVCSAEYKQAWSASNGKVGDDSHIVRSHLKSQKVIPLLRDGNSGCIPQELNGFRGVDFRNNTSFVVHLFELVLGLYAVPLNHPAFKPLLDEISQRWKENFEGRFEADKQIFISYAWGDEREEIVDQVDAEFQRRGVTIIRDKRDLGFKGSIKGFMEKIGTGKAVLLVISEKYLKSPNCCFELVQIAKQGQFKDRIFPIVLNDANIYEPAKRLRYVKHWEYKKAELDDLMKTVSAANMDGFREDIDLYAEIRALLPRLMDVLRDMNTLTPDLHRQSDFSEIYDAVMAKLEE